MAIKQYNALLAALATQVGHIAERLFEIEKIIGNSEDCVHKLEKLWDSLLTTKCQLEAKLENTQDHSKRNNIRIVVFKKNLRVQILCLL